MNSSNFTKLISVLLPTIALLVVVMFINDYWLRILTMIAINIILAASLRLSLVAGMFNMGQIAFYAIGAYSSMMLITKLNISFWIALPLSGILAVLFAFFLGVITTKVKGFYFCMLTLAFVEFIRLAILAIPALGANNPVTIPSPNPIIIPHVLTLNFVSNLSNCYLAIILLAIVLAILYRIEKSQMGTILKSLGINEDLAESFGADTRKYRVMAFCLSSFFAGIAGSFYASYVTIIGPSFFTVLASVIILMTVFIGGINSFWGPIIGAVILTLLPQLLRMTSTVQLQPTIYAVCLILVIFLMPNGLVSALKLIYNKIPAKVKKRLPRLPSEPKVTDYTA